jgi:uncharacterized membrane protein
MIHYLKKNLSEKALCPESRSLPDKKRSSPVTPIHPFLVHFALSLALLTATGELFPGLRDRFPPTAWRLAEMGTLLFLFLALITGWLAIETLSRQETNIPSEAALHRLLAVAGTTTYALFWLSNRKGIPALSRGSRRLIVLFGLLLVLSAAAVGGHLVYDDRLGTDFMTPSSPPASPHP